MYIQGDDKIQTKTKISNGLQSASSELNLMDDLQTKPHDINIQDEIEVGTSDDELICDNEIFSDVLTKIKAFIDQSKQEKFDKNIFIIEWQILHDFFNLMEKK